jgi:hypothetical protein
MFESKPKEYTSPLEKGNNPEIDMAEELDDGGIKKYQTMIGCYSGQFLWVGLTFKLLP